MCRVSDGIVEEDLMESGSAREPLRTCCHKLALMSWALFSSCFEHLQENESKKYTHGNTNDFQNLPLVRNIGLFHTAVLSAISASSSEHNAKSGRLDNALCDLAIALDSCPQLTDSQIERPTMTRLDALESIVPAIQAAAMCRSRWNSVDQPMKGLTDEKGPEDFQSQEDMKCIEQEVSSASVDPEAALMSQSLRHLAETVGLEQIVSLNSAAEIALLINERIQYFKNRLPDGFFEAILSEEMLSDSQLNILADVNETLKKEYALRRHMLLERANLTIKSFLWSRKLDTEDAHTNAEKLAQQYLENCPSEPNVSLSDLFNATLADVMTITERATSTSGKVEQAFGAPGNDERPIGVKGVLIGVVPDRGGRAEGRLRSTMPSWTARESDDGGGPGRSSRGRGKFQKRGRGPGGHTSRHHGKKFNKT